MNATIAVPEEWVESVSELTFPKETDERMQELMSKNNEGLLTRNEKKQLKAYVEMSEALSLVRASAYRFLDRAPARG